MSPEFVAYNMIHFFKITIVDVWIIDQLPMLRFDRICNLDPPLHNDVGNCYVMHVEANV